MCLDGAMIRVLVAEDVRILRDALTSLLRLEDDIDVVADVASGTDAVPAALEHQPDIAVLDIDLPGRDGLTVAADLRERLPECRVLILTGLARPGNLRRALAAGVCGFLVKDAPAEDFVDALRKIAAGRRVIDPELALAALEAAPNPLTAREQEILGRLAEGDGLDEIAEGLHLASGTVRNYLASAVTKLGARNRTDAVRVAREAGWL
jgi:two-component system response regulator DesR